MGHRIYLYIQNDDGQEQIAEAKNGIPALWKVLLAEAYSGPAIDIQRVLTDCGSDNLVVPLLAARTRAELVFDFLQRHPAVASLPQLPRFLAAARQFLADLQERYGDEAELSADIDELFHLSSSGYDPDDYEPGDYSYFETAVPAWAASEMESINLSWQQALQALRDGQHARFDVALTGDWMTPAAWLEWKSWLWVFGLGGLDHPFFSADPDDGVEYTGLIDGDGDYDEDEDEDEAESDEDHITADCWRFQDGERYGLRRGQDADAPLVMAAEFENIGRLDEAGGKFEHLFAYQENGLWGLADSRSTPAQRLTAAAFDDMWYFAANGHAAVRRDDREGLINSLGQIVVPLEYQELGNYDGKLIGALQNDRWGLIDHNGALVVPHRYLDMLRSDEKPISDQRRVQNENGWGLLAADGSELLPCVHSSISWDEDRRLWQLSQTDAEGIELFSLMQPDGHIVMQPSEGELRSALFKHLPGERQLIKRHGEHGYGISDEHGKELLPCRYEDITPLHADVLGERLLNVTRDGAANLLTLDGVAKLPAGFSSIELLSPWRKAISQHPRWRGLLQVGQKTAQKKRKARAEERYGVWLLDSASQLLPCQYSAIAPIFAAGMNAEPLFIVERPAHPDEPGQGQDERMGILRADGSALFAEDYAWIGKTSSIVEHGDTIAEEIEVLWRKGTGAQAWNARHNRVEYLFADGSTQSYADHLRQRFTAGDWAAGFELADAVEYGKAGVAQDAELARALWRELSERAPASDPDSWRGRALNSLAWVGIDSLEESSNPAATLALLREAAELIGDRHADDKSRALNNAGYMIEHGMGTEADAVLGTQLYEQAAALGNPRASYNAGVNWRNGSAGQVDLERAIRYFDQAMRANFPNAQASLGYTQLLHARASNDSTLFRKAAAHLRYCWQQGDAPEWVGGELGQLALDGYVEASRSDIESWLTQAAEAEDEDAIRTLATRFYTPDDPAGVPWRQRWAELNPPPPEQGGLVSKIKGWLGGK